MNKFKKRIYEEQLTNQIFTQNDYLNLWEDLSSKHVAISGMGVFIMDYSLIFIVCEKVNTSNNVIEFSLFMFCSRWFQQRWHIS